MGRDSRLLSTAFDDPGAVKRRVLKDAFDQFAARRVIRVADDVLFVTIVVFAAYLVSFLAVTHRLSSQYSVEELPEPRRRWRPPSRNSLPHPIVGLKRRASKRPRVMCQRMPTIKLLANLFLPWCSREGDCQPACIGEGNTSLAPIGRARSAAVGLLAACERRCNVAASPAVPRKSSWGGGEPPMARQMTHQLRRSTRRTVCIRRAGGDRWACALVPLGSYYRTFDRSRELAIIGQADDRARLWVL